MQAPLRRRVRVGKKLIKRHGWHYRLAHDLGKHLHEVMGWPGPMTHRQFLGWLLLIQGDPQERIEAGKREADAAIAAAKTDPNATVVSVKRSEIHPGKAAELLLSGVSRKPRNK